MFDVLAARKRASAPVGPVVSPAGDFEAYPLLSKLFCGVLQQSGEKFEVPRHSLILSPRNDGLLVILSAGDDEPKFYLTLDSLSGVLDVIEKKLASGGGSWRDPKQNGKH